MFRCLKFSISKCRAAGNSHLFATVCCARDRMRNKEDTHNELERELNEAKYVPEQPLSVVMLES